MAIKISNTDVIDNNRRIVNLAAGTAAAPSVSFTDDANTGMYRPGANTLAFSTNGEPKMTVLANGNVGIGTSDPSDLLHVDGSVRFTGPITIDGSGGEGSEIELESLENAIGSGVERALSEIGLLAVELERNQTVRHQEGEFTLVNRGVKSGCGLSKSTTANRSLNIAAGVCFMHGAEMPVDAEENAASVPSNSGSEGGTAEAYLYILDGRVRLGVTGLNEEAPESSLVLASLSVPAGSTGTTAPQLEDVVITTVARQEPDWPLMQTSPAFTQEDFDRVMGGNSYHLALDVVAFVGGEFPRLVQNEADRSTNTFRVYLGGLADAVRVRYVAHLMNQ